MPKERPVLEFAVLRLLCAPNFRLGSREQFAKRIAPSIFRDPSNRVVFEEIRSLSRLPFPRFRELLPARVTKRGIPDFDFHSLLEGEPLHAEEFRETLQALKTLHAWNEVEAGALLKLLSDD